MSRWPRCWLAVLGILFLIPCLSAQASEGGATPRSRVELSVRWWMFTNGETEWSQNASTLDPSLGNPTSELTYEDNNTQIIELAGRVNLSRRWFVHGEFGFSIGLDRGLLVDNDYTAVGGQRLFSQTNSNITGSGTQYVNLNVGYRVKEFAGSRGYLDVFGGLQYWRTEYQASGVQQVVCTPSGIPGVSCTPDTNIVGVLALTNTTHWFTPLQVGLGTEYRFTHRVSVDFKAFVSPVSILYNEDVHHLRTDLQQDPSFSMWGLGASANAGAFLKFMLTRNLVLTGGYRVMWNSTYTGTWENHPVGSGSQTAPLTEFQTLRYGPIVGLTASF